MNETKYNNEIKYSRSWECISQNSFRREVWNGWHVKEVETIICGDKVCGVSMHIFFYEDPEKLWKLKDK